MLNSCLTRRSVRPLLSFRCPLNQRGQHGSSFELDLDDEGYLPSRSRVVVCGGGVMGASVAYHLAELGWGEHTIILEKGR